MKRKKLRKKFKKRLRKGLLILIILVVIGIIVSLFIERFEEISNVNKIIIENPLKNIVLENTDDVGEVDLEVVVQQGVSEFDEDYVNYLLLSLGVGKLHKSYIGYGNPIIEFNMNGELWGSELISGRLITRKGEIDK